jgi:hypothetical protein
MPVNATFRLDDPLSMVLSICSPEPTLISVQFCMNTPLCLSSLISNLDFDATFLEAILTIQQIKKLFVVNLDVGTFYYEFYVLVGFRYGLK